MNAVDADDEPIAVLTASGLPLRGPDGRPIRRRRADVHAEGLWHAAFHLWVVTPDGLLLQRRAASKASWPSALDATAAGHLLADESVLDGLREVREELGVSYTPQQLHAIGTFKVEDPMQSNGINREHQHVFAVYDKRPLKQWQAFDRDEIDGLVAVDILYVPALFCDRATVRATAWDGTTAHPTAVSGAELVPAPYLPLLAHRLTSIA